MLSKSVLAFAFLAVSRVALAAQPPACLLAAINTQQNPADLAKVCGNSSDVQKTILEVCKSNAEEAVKSFVETCKGAGVTVSAISVSPSATGSKNASSSGPAATGTNRDPSGGSATKSGNGLPGTTGAASKFESGNLAAVAVAAVGLVAAL